MERQIFRKEALDRLSSPEQLDQLMQVTSPRGWIVLAALLLLLGGAVAWAALGSIPITAEGQGFLMRSRGVTPVLAHQNGIVASVPVKVGDKPNEGDPLITLRPAEGGAVDAAPIPCPFPARVLEATVREGDAVAEGATLLIIERQEDRLQAVLYVPVGEGYPIESGKNMRVEIWPEPANKGVEAPLVGHVASAAKFPAGPSEILRRLQSDQLASSLAKAPPSLEIVVDVDVQKEGTPAYSGTPCQGRITVDRRSPFRLMFPTSGSSSGP